jgi:hypothetical protein
VASKHSERVDFVKTTTHTWKAHTLRDLTGEEARQAIENITGFFRTLEQWDSNGRREDERQRDPNKVQET